MRLPLTLLSGYLGAGKTTLINRLLAADHGLRLLVIVNDFGAINLDATLIETTSDTSIALSNGCICCTMQDDLFAALNAALDRSPRPDHILIEASGIADPAAIAAAALIEREIAYGGIITLVDATNIEALLDAPETAPHVSQQIKSADLTLITKTKTKNPDLVARLTSLGARTPGLLSDTPVETLLFDVTPLPRTPAPQSHPAYISWSHDSTLTLSRATMGTLLKTRPPGLFRLKCFVLTDDGAYEIHVVGQHVTARRTRADRTTLVALGLASALTRDEIETWWQTAT